MTRRPISRLAILCVFLVAGAIAMASARADITLTLDTVAKTLSFSGTDSGTPFNVPDKGFVVWKSDNYTETNDWAADDFTGGIPWFTFNLFSTSVSAIDDTTGFLLQSTGGSLIGLYLPNTTGTALGVITVSADPARSFNYGTHLTESQAAILEAEVGGQATLAKVVGAGFSPINTRVVPEPGTVGLLALAAALLGWVWWRGRRPSDPVG